MSENTTLPQRLSAGDSCGVVNWKFCGTAGFMFGNAVSNQFVGGTTDWQTGSVLALFLVVVVLGLTAATTKFLRQGGGA